jgi:hypothetical protein
VGTQGQLTTQSGTTVEGGPGLVLDNVLDVHHDNVHLGVDGQRVLSVLRRDVSLHEPALGDNVGELFLAMFTRVMIVGVLSACCFFTSAFSNLPCLANTSSNLILVQASCFTRSHFTEYITKCEVNATRDPFIKGVNVYKLEWRKA